MYFLWEDVSAQQRSSGGGQLVKYNASIEPSTENLRNFSLFARQRFSFDNGTAQGARAGLSSPVPRFTYGGMLIGK